MKRDRTALERTKIMRAVMQNNLNRIKELLVDLSKYAKIENSNGELSINRAAENIIAGLLNIIFDSNLKNLNTEIKNYPAIDLGDKSKKLAVQVTVTDKSNDKVRKMLKRIKENKMYEPYEVFYFFIISTEKQVLAQEKADEIICEKFKFPVKNIININDVYEMLQNEDLARIIKVRKYLERHLESKGVVSLLFGTKMRAAISISIFSTIAITLILIIVFTHSQSHYINYDLDDHLILELSNANHQYNEGLYNWKRLDYNRAERDILAARDEISEHISQYDIEVARINNSLGCLYLDMGKYEQAYEYLNKALVTFNDKFDDSSIETRSVMFSIAQYDYCMGNYERSIQTIQSILDITDVKKDKAVIAALKHYQASIYDSLGKYEKAVSIYQQVGDLYKEIWNDGKLTDELADYTVSSGVSKSKNDERNNAIKWILRTGNELGVTYIHLEQYDAAGEILMSCINLCKENVYIGIQNLTASELYMNLAIAQGKLGKDKEAIENIDKAMRIQRKLFDYNGNYPGLVEVYDVYAELLMEQNDYDGAEKYVEMSLALARDSFGENHPLTASAYNMLGVFWYESGKYADAVKAFSSSIEIRKNILSVDHPDTARYYINLAKAQLMLRDETDAEKSFAAAQEIYNKFGVSVSMEDDISDYIKDV